MTHFFLISGSEGHRLDWQSCVLWLRSKGYEVTAFGWEDLPWDQGLEGVVDSLRERVCRVTTPVLVGHSAGGLIVPRISQGVKVRAEIYLAALAPQSGLSFVEQIFSSPVEVFNSEYMATYHAEPSKIAILTELYEASFSEYTEADRLYLSCLADKEIRPEWQRWVAKEVLHAEISLLEADHYAHITLSEEVCTAATAFSHKYGG